MNKTEAKENYGLTDSQLDRIPHEKVKRYGGGHFCIFNDDKVAQLAESLGGKETLLAKRATRSVSARKIAEMQKQKLIRKAQQLPIKVEQVTRKQLVYQACDNYNCAEKRCRDDNSASANSDAEFLDRISLNYVRHSLTSYDNCLVSIKGEVGVKEAYGIIRGRITDRIREVYPWLSKAISAQESYRTNM